MSMECRYCSKTFSKGEHLRRHERSHTGARPFVCRECKRPFARQDALLRHERLHTRKPSSSTDYASPASTSSAAQPLTPSSHTSEPQVGINGHINPQQHKSSPVASTPQQQQQQQQPWMEQHQPRMNMAMPEMQSTHGLEYDLMWPDTEALYHTIMSLDTTNQWQVPVGALPFPPGMQPVDATSPIAYRSPDSFDSRPPAIGAIPSGGSHRALNDVHKMVSNLSSSVTAAVEATSITSVFLDECLHMFFVRFIPTFPIMHRATFVFRDCIQPLLLNAMAIGSLYLGPKDSIGKGEALWRLAHIAVATSWESLITHRGPYDAGEGVQLVTTALLGQVYGALSKNRDIRTTSQAFHAFGLFWARHCCMFDAPPYDMNRLPGPNATEADINREWKVWAAREIQQRALLGHYILDGLSARMSGRPASARHSANKLGVPSPENIFEAGSAHEWLRLMRVYQPSQITFRGVFRALFSFMDAPPISHLILSGFALRVIIEGLHTFVTDCSDEDAAVGLPSKAEVRCALVQAYDCILRPNKFELPQEDRLETLLQWHVTCLNASVDSSLLCRHVCSRYNIAQHVWGGRQDTIPGLDLVSWVQTEDARRALLHAIAIQDIIEQLPRGRAHVVHIPTCLFSAATVYSVFALSGVAQVRLPGVVDWKYLVACRHDPVVVLAELAHAGTASADHETKRFLMGEMTAGQDGGAVNGSGHQQNNMFAPQQQTGVARNLLYELNSMQKLFRCLNSQWGVSFDMESVMDQWIGLCH